MTTPSNGLAILILPILLGTTRDVPAFAAEQPVIRAESAAAASLRHTRVAARRKSIAIICHRGASEHAHENTLEAYRATFELGGDGNEFDIRRTKDGVLVCFHDDMLDRLLEAYGDVSDYTWDELQRFPFREPGRFGEQCRIPTLVEVFELHRKYAGLMHLDVKQPRIDRAISDLLSRMDMWDQVAYCNMENGGVILKNSQLKLRRYKSNGLYQDRSDVFPDKIASALAADGDDVIVDDPRGVAVALHRKVGMLSTAPVSMRRPVGERKVVQRSKAELVAILRDAADWNQIATSEPERDASARRITARAKAADELFHLRSHSKEVFAALEERARNRSLHRDWRYHGIDGAAALRTLILLGAPGAVDTAKFVLWRDDPSLSAIADKGTPRVFVDFRQKMAIFPALKHIPREASEKLCRDYLALGDVEANRVGAFSFEDAAITLLAISPKYETAVDLLHHRLRTVRGRAILDCLAHSREPWARRAFQETAPFALKYRTAEEPAELGATK